MPAHHSNNITGSCNFTDHSARSGLTNKRRLGAYLCQLIASYRKKPAFLGYTFLNDEDLLHMNQTHLDHDTYTDIITFDLSEKGQEGILGDIYISVDRVRENARELGIPYRDELIRVIIHGALHLCGFKDKTKAQKQAMRELENKSIRDFLKQVS